MPTVADASTLNTTQLFRREFLTAGGLHLVCRVLRKDFFPYEVSYEVRQGCCLVALQLARFLLCGEVDEPMANTAIKLQTTPSKLQLTPTKLTPTKISPLRPTSATKFQSSPTKQQSLNMGFSFSPVKENAETAKAAIQVLQTLNESEFLDMISCFLRVCWAAAAGKLHLAYATGSTTTHLKDALNVIGSELIGNGGVTLMMNAPLMNAAGRRSRQSSSGSTSSNSSSGDTSDSGGLYFGICALQEQLCNKDVLIACEALELLVTCLEVRGSKELTAFYNIPYVKGCTVSFLLCKLKYLILNVLAFLEFVVDVLLGCVGQEVRDRATAQFYRLSQAQSQSNKHSMLQVKLQ